MARTGIIIQARMSSSRLPNKVLMELPGGTMLRHIVERCKASTKADEVIVATSTEQSDDVIELFCKEYDYTYFRGSLNDVLGRFYECAKKYKFDYIVRAMGESPFLEPSTIDGVIEELLLHEKEGVSYVSSWLKNTHPKGLDAEVFSFSTLKEAQHKAATEEEREHVTPYIRKHFTTKPYNMPKELHGDFRLTVDEEDDFKLVDHLYRRFYKKGELIDTREVIAYLKNHPEVTAINNHIVQKTVSY